MKVKHKILLIAAGQYGYHSGFFFYSQYLKKHYDVTFLGLESGRTIVPSQGVSVIHIPYRGMIRYQIDIIRQAKILHKENNFSFICISYFTACSLSLLTFPQKKLSIDIRTSFILKNNPLKEKIYNKLIKIEFGFFKNRTIISENLASHLHINKNFTVFPLGGEVSKEKCFQKEYNSINLIYLGTFYDRKIEITLQGLNLFLKKNRNNIELNYTIIGFGSEKEISIIKNTINDLSLNKYVNYIGEVRYPNTIKYLLNSNVGVSFVPCTKYYDCQPPTKTYEYLLYGMPVIATCTKENQLVINNSNGVLIEDTIEGFCRGLEHIIQRKNEYNNLNIQKKNIKYSWNSIVENIILPYLDKRINIAN